MLILTMRSAVWQRFGDNGPGCVGTAWRADTAKPLQAVNDWRRSADSRVASRRSRLVPLSNPVPLMASVIYRVAHPIAIWR